MFKNFFNNKKTSGNGVFALDILLNVVVIVVLVFVVRTYVVAPFQVFGPSMCDTLNNKNGECLRGYGEYIVVNKLGYQFHDANRGEIIVFHPPHNEEEFYIKRIVGLPGESIKFDKGEVYVKKNENDTWTMLEESYLNEYNAHKTTIFSDKETEFKIPEGNYFVMGDNRRSSTDSRSCFTDPFGGGCKGKDATPFITMDNIEGRAWFVLWPLDGIRMLKIAEYSI